MAQSDVTSALMEGGGLSIHTFVFCSTNLFELNYYAGHFRLIFSQCMGLKFPPNFVLKLKYSYFIGCVRRQ